MIVDAFVNFMLACMNTVLNIFPDMPPGMPTQDETDQWLWTAGSKMLEVLQPFIPVRTILNLVMMYFAAEVAYALIVAVVWVFNKLRGAG